MPRKKVGGSKKAKQRYPHGRFSIAQAVKRAPKSERKKHLLGFKIDSFWRKMF